MLRVTSKFYRISLIVLALVLSFNILQETQPSVAQSGDSRLVTAILGDFEPEKDGFKFTNPQLTQEILAAYSNPQTLRDKTYINSLAMSRMFGEENVCLDGTHQADTGYSSCVLTAPARRWLAQNIKAMANGVCEGMGLTSFFLWLGRHNPDVNWRIPRTAVISKSGILEDGETGTSRAVDVPITDREFHTYVTIMFSMQAIDKVYNNAKAIRETKKPSEMVQILESTLQNSSNWDKIFNAAEDDLYTIGIYRKDADGRLIEGHTLLPYKIWDMGNGIKHVVVYDPNYVYSLGPTNEEIFTDSTYIEFDGDNWTYQPPKGEAYTGNANSQNLDLSLLSTRNLPIGQSHECTFCTSETTSVEVALIGSGDLSVTNLSNTNAALQNVAFIPFKGGLDLDVPPTYLLPADESYQINLKGTNDDSEFEDEAERLGSDLVISGSGYMIGVEELDLRPNNEFVMYVESSQSGPELTFEATTGAAVPTMFVTLDDGATSYEFEISGVNISSDKDAVVRIDSVNKRLFFTDNDGVDDTYSFTIARINADGAEDSLNADVLLGAEEVAYLDYGEWEKRSSELPFYFADAADLEQENEDYLTLDINAETSYSRKVIRGGGRFR